VTAPSTPTARAAVARAPAPVPPAAAPAQQPPAPSAPTAPSQDVNVLIAQAAQDLADYQRLTADGKLAEAGQKLEHLKRTLEQLKKR